MKLDNVQVDMESFINNAQLVKELTIEILVKQEIITSEQGNKFCDEYQVILVQPKWYKRWASKIFDKEMDWIYKIVKFT